MKPKMFNKRIFIVFLVVLLATFLVADTIYLPLVIGTGAAETDEVLIPAGTFQMGCFESCNFPNDANPHPVSLDTYYIDKYEVTNAQYKACVTAGSCTAPSDTTAYNDAGKLNHPVVYVNWDQAAAYCEWAGKRLPTEAEWEKAARGDGYPRLYPWGEAIPDARWVNFETNVGDTTPVGSYSAGVTPYGVHDMAGNVFEWVNDWYDATYYDDPSALENPKGPDSGTSRVVRGGAWLNDDDMLMVADRDALHPTGNQESYGGFRCARTP